MEDQDIKKEEQLSENEILINEIKDLKREIQKLAFTNLEVINIATNNYKMIDAIFKQNNKSLNKVSKRTDTTLKILYISISFVLLIIILLLISMINLHFLKN